MMRRLLSLSVLLLALSATAVAQQPTRAEIERSDAILAKLKRLDLLNQILPIGMTPDQIRAILPAVEEARSLVNAQQKNEAQTLAQLEPTVDDALSDAEELDSVPPLATIEEIEATLRLMYAQRQIVTARNTADVLEALRETLDAGQLRAAAGSFEPRFLAEPIEVEELTEAVKLEAWVTFVLLDPLAYELLVEMSQA